MSEEDDGVFEEIFEEEVDEEEEAQLPEPFHYNENINSDHPYSVICTNCHSLEEEIKKLKTDKNYFQNQSNYWKRRFHIINNKYEDLLRPEPLNSRTRNICHKITKATLVEKGGFFSKGQIDVALKAIEAKKNKKKKLESHSWSHKDYIKSFRVKSFGGIKSLEYIKDDIVPLPSPSTIRKQFGFMHLGLRFLKPALMYLRDLMTVTKDIEKLCVISFDETRTSQLALFDPKLDQLLKGKDAQCIAARSILGDWFFPIFLDFDCKVDVPLWEEAVDSLESVGVPVICSVCDQGIVHVLILFSCI